MARETSWEIDVPLLTNRIILGGILRAFGLAGLIMGSLLSLLVAAQGDWDAIGPLWLMSAIVCGALIVVSFGVMAIVFRNRMRFRFTVSDEGVLAEQIDRTARAANRLTVLAGVVGASPGTSGAGLIAASQERQWVDYSGAFSAEFLPRQRVIAFRNSWRRILFVYCTPQNYEDIASRVRAAMDAQGTAMRVPGRSPLWRYIGYTVLMVAMSVPALAAVEAFDVPLIIPILMLCFGVAMIWLVGLFGVVVIGTALAQVAFIVADAMSRVESYFDPGSTYVRWTVYSGDDWALIVFTLAGLVAISFVSAQMLRGRLASALTADFADMAGDATGDAPGEKG